MSAILFSPQWVNKLMPRQNAGIWHFQTYFLEWKCYSFNLNFTKGPINNIPALVQIMVRRRPGDKPLSEPMMVRLPAYICVTQPQWVNWYGGITQPSITLYICSRYFFHLTACNKYCLSCRSKKNCSKCKKGYKPDKKGKCIKGNLNFNLWTALKKSMFKKPWYFLSWYLMKPRELMLKAL